MDVELHHIIYSLIPYKGYGVRAWSSREVVSEIERAFKGWFSPYEQHVVKPSSELRAVVGSPNNFLYIARVFVGERLDELNRKGIVSHIVSIPMNLVLEARLQLEHVDRAMHDYIASRGIEQGNVEPIKLSVPEGQVDGELERFKKIVDIESARKILSNISKPYGKVMVVYKRDIWSRVALAFMLSKALAIHGLREYIVLNDKPIDNILIEYEHVVVVLDKVLPIRRLDEWSVVKVAEEEKREALDLEETLRKIYKQ